MKLVATFWGSQTCRACTWWTPSSSRSGRAPPVHVTFMRTKADGGP